MHAEDKRVFEPTCPGRSAQREVAFLRFLVAGGETAGDMHSGGFRACGKEEWSEQEGATGHRGHTHPNVGSGSGLMK